MSQLSESQKLQFTRVLQDFAVSVNQSARELSLSSDTVLDIITPAKVALLLDYLGLFIKWNKTYNLSAIRDPEEMLYKHLIDSLVTVPYVAANSWAQAIADVGTGGGLPGIPLAICFPERKFTLLDSAGKKMRFLFQVKQSLALENVDLQNLRVENYQPMDLYDVVTSRAFASLQDMTKWCDHLLANNGCFWAMKGVFPEDELRAVEKSYIVEQKLQLNVPGLEGERCLISLKKSN